MQNVLNFNRWMAAYAADRYARDFRKNGGTGRFIYANSEPQPNAKYSCAASVAIAR
jgi:hypothetical protein